MSVEISSYYLWLTFLLPFAGALLMPLLGRLGRVRDLVAVAFPFLSALCALQLLIPVLQSQFPITLVGPTSVPWISVLGINEGVLSDPLTVIISNVVAWISFLIMVYSVDYMKGDPGISRYWFFMSFFIGNMQLLVLSDNLLALFIGWEGVGLCSYALIGHYYKDDLKDWVGTPGKTALGEEQAYSPSHAGMKAFVMTRIGDIAMLAGILILFIYSGTFNYQQLAASTGWAVALSKNGLLVPVALLIFGGAVGKSAQFPLQEWLPDAMAGPAPVSALIHAATMVKAGVVLVARIGPIFYFAMAADPALIQPFFITVACVGAFTAVLAASQALVGFELKKILAYSTGSQIGYMMLALGVAGLSSDFAQGLSAGLFQLISHAIFKAALFMMAGVLIHTTGSKYINEMGGLRDKMKVTFATFLIAVASLSGIPPLSGFWSKDAVLSATLASGQTLLFLVGSLTAAITAFYSFRMLGIVFFGQKSSALEEVEEHGHGPHEAGPISFVPYVILGTATVVIGIWATITDVGGFLNSVAEAYLVSFFPAAATQLTSIAVPPPDYESMGFTLLLVVIGFLLASQLYFTHRFSPARIVASSSLTRGLYTFLENRWYINAIYYKVFVNAPLSMSQWLAVRFELGALERINDAGASLGIYSSTAGNWVDRRVVDGAANGISGVGQAFSRAFKRLQTGLFAEYVFALVIGAVVLLVVFILIVGVPL